MKKCFLPLILPFHLNLVCWSFGGVFPLDFHQLISGDSVDDSRRCLDQVGAKPELFHFMVSFLHFVPYSLLF